MGPALAQNAPVATAPVPPAPPAASGPMTPVPVAKEPPAAKAPAINLPAEKPAAKAPAKLEPSRQAASPAPAAPAKDAAPAGKPASATTTATTTTENPAKPPEKSAARPKRPVQRPSVAEREPLPREDRRYEDADPRYDATPQSGPRQDQRYDRGYAEVWREREEPSYRATTPYYAPAPYQRQATPWQSDPYPYGYAPCLTAWRDAAGIRALPRCPAAMGTLKTLHHGAETRRRTGLIAIIVAGALLGFGAPAQAAGEPVATAPIPPPPAAAATPMVVPLSQRAFPAPPKTTAPKTAAPKLTRPAEGERKRTDTADRRQPAMRDAANPKKQAGSSKAQPTARERHQFQLPGDPNLVQVPATALISGTNSTQVAVLGDGDKVVMKPIQIGHDFGDSLEVVAGLTPSDRVIDSPPETLQTGDQVQLTATPPAGTAPAALPSSAKAD